MCQPLNQGLALLHSITTRSPRLSAYQLEAEIWKRLLQPGLPRIHGKDGLHDHKLASLTHIAASFWQAAMILGKNSTLFCHEKNWRVFESIGVSGEFMRLKNQYWLIHSSSRNWRIYAPEVASLSSF